VKQQLQRFSVHQTARVLATVYGILGFVLIPLIWISIAFDPASEGGAGLVAFLFPLIYAIFGYIFTAIGCAIYNAVAARLGGIEFTLSGPGAEPHI